MKEILASLLLTSRLLPLAACGSDDPASDTTADTARAKPLRLLPPNTQRPL